MSGKAWCLSFDFGLSTGICLVGRGRQGFVLEDYQRLDFGDGKTTRATVHNPQFWSIFRGEVKRVVLSSFSWATRNDGSFLVAYEQVNFSKSVWWAQLYGGMLATALQVVHEEIGRYCLIVPINVSTAKAALTGDSGACKERMVAALKSRHEVAGEKLDDIADSYAVAIAALGGQ